MSLVDNSTQPLTGGEVWAYCRSSVTNPDVMERQVEWAKSFADSRQARLVVFRENSSAAAGRTQFGELVQRMERSEGRAPDFLIAASLDRLSRSNAEIMALANVLRENSVRLFVRDIGEVDLDEISKTG